MQEILDRTIAPAINPIDRFHLPKVETVSFSNGNILHKFALAEELQVSKKNRQINQIVN